jgi:hypothetical protein
MTSFSTRMGITQPKAIQTDDMDTELRNSLWNICRHFFFTQNQHTSVLAKDGRLHYIASELYVKHYKFPVDNLPFQSSDFVKMQLARFQNAPWFDVYNTIEFLHAECLREGSIDQQEFEGQISNVLETEKSAYRFICGKLASITNEIEMHELEQAARHRNRFEPVSEHIRTALGLYSKKPQPDYRNSIKESISAVECAAKIITGKPKATLDAAIKIIDQKHSLHGAFKAGISQMYGYTSDEGGIRHSLIEATNIDETDARYMLVSCSAFANYLICRYAERS